MVWILLLYIKWSPQYYCTHARVGLTSLNLIYLLLLLSLQASWPDVTTTVTNRVERQKSLFQLPRVHVLATIVHNGAPEGRMLRTHHVVRLVLFGTMCMQGTTCTATSPIFVDELCTEFAPPHNQCNVMI